MSENLNANVETTAANFVALVGVIQGGKHARTGEPRFQVKSHKSETLSGHSFVQCSIDVDPTSRGRMPLINGNSGSFRSRYANLLLLGTAQNKDFGDHAASKLMPGAHIRIWAKIEDRTFIVREWRFVSSFVRKDGAKSSSRHPYREGFVIAKAEGALVAPSPQGPWFRHSGTAWISEAEIAEMQADVEETCSDCDPPSSCTCAGPDEENPNWWREMGWCCPDPELHAPYCQHIADPHAPDGSCSICDAPEPQDGDTVPCMGTTKAGKPCGNTVIVGSLKTRDGRCGQCKGPRQ